MPEIVIGRDQEDMKKFGKEGTLYIGKNIVGKGIDAHITSPVLIDVLRPHIITLTGKRGEGKSYSMGILMEEIAKLPEEVKTGLCVLTIDTQGIFWTMKSPAEVSSSMREWGMGPSGFGIHVYVPEGQSSTFTDAAVPFDGTFSIAPEQLGYADWLYLFSISMNENMGILLHRVLRKMGKQYSIEDIIVQLRDEDGFEKEKMSLENLFESAKYWGIFGEKKMPKILEPGKISVLDVSLTPQNIRELLVSLLTRWVFRQRTRARRQEEMAVISSAYVKHVPMCWIMIDEAHNFIPNEGKTAATESLLKIVKEGRQPGISLVLATQQPYKLHPDALSQCDMIIAHRLTAKTDIDALKSIMQTYILFDITKYIEELPRIKGVALVLDDNSERLYKMRMRPRQSWHAGSSPTAIYKA